MRQRAAVEEVGPHKGNNKVISTTSIFVFGLSGNSVTDLMCTVAHIKYTAACESQYKFSSEKMILRCSAMRTWKILNQCSDRT